MDDKALLSEAWVGLVDNSNRVLTQKTNMIVDAEAIVWAGEEIERLSSEVARLKMNSWTTGFSL